MTNYTSNFSLPYPEGRDNVAVHSDIAALAQQTDASLQREGLRVEKAARQYTDSELDEAMKPRLDRVGIGMYEIIAPYLDNISEGVYEIGA